MERSDKDTEGAMFTIGNIKSFYACVKDLFIELKVLRVIRDCIRPSQLLHEYYSKICFLDVPFQNAALQNSYTKWAKLNSTTVT